MKIIQLFLALVFFFLSACSILKGNKTILDIDIRFNETAPILYGHTFEITVFAIYSNGKEKEITHKNECSLSVTGGTYSKGKISISSYPTVPETDTIAVKASYLAQNKSWTKEIKIPFNYLDHLTVSFNGIGGENGGKGKDKGTPLIVRNGNDGEQGEDGAPGENGHQLALYIWKENTTDLYRIKVNDLITNTFYFYSFRDHGYGLNFIVNGGQGGKGGIGGSALIFLHPSAIELEKKIIITNNGGLGGNGGKGGDRGLPVKPLNGQNPGQKGVEGKDGLTGMNGLAGDPYQLIIEEFEFIN